MRHYDRIHFRAIEAMILNLACLVLPDLGFCRTPLIQSKVQYPQPRKVCEKLWW